MGVKETNKGFRGIIFGMIFAVAVCSFMAGMTTVSTIKSHANDGQYITEDILLQKTELIENIVTTDGVSAFAGGKKQSELVNLSVEKLTELNNNNVKVVIYNEPVSYIDEQSNVVYISVKATEGQIIDFINALY